MTKVKYNWWVLPLFIIWSIASAYYYVCIIKSFCDMDARDDRSDIHQNRDIQMYRDDDYDLGRGAPTNIPVNDTEKINQQVPEVILPKVDIGPGAAVKPICSVYLNSYLKVDVINDKNEVVKLQDFLNKYEGENLSVDGNFDISTYESVKRFQNKYAQDVLLPFGVNYKATGHVLQTTKAKINQLYCQYNNLN